MNLDQHQVAEFQRHWGDSYMLYKGNPVYVQSVHGHDVNVVNLANDDRKLSVPMKELEIFNPETGYYNSVSTMGFPLAVFLTRLPRQHQSRGFSARNADVSIPLYKDKGIVFGEHNRSFHNEVLSFSNQDYGRGREKIKALVEFKRGSNNPVFKAVKEDWREPGARIPKDNVCPSVALSKNIAAIRTKWGYLVLMYRKTPIGFYNEGKVYLNTVASSYKEQLEELQLGEFVWN
jgi:hypothetical protein